MKKAILITGGAGYIGSHAVKLFLQKGFHVVIFDNLSRGYLDAIDILKTFGDVEFIQGDLHNKEDIREAFKGRDIDAVLHFAALCLVNESMEQPELYFENNTMGSLNLFEVMRESNVRNIVFSSTCATYGETEYLPVDELHPTNPTNPYGESKLLTEKILRWYGDIHGFHYAILRYFNVCGADSEGRIGDSKKPSQLLVQNVVRGAMNIEPFYYTCPTVDTPDGTPIRDYIDVEDLVDAHFNAYEYLIDGGKSDTFNLGNGTGNSVREIVSSVEKVFNVTILEQKSPEARKGEYAKIYANPKKAQKVLHWTPKKTITDSIESLQKWYEKFPNGYKQ
ncbi:MAG: UDP-glucose 4-epimerase GalE [bacterium]